MFTKKLTDQFTASLLSAVSGVLNEAKKCEDCDCAKCECDDAEEVDEATSLSDTLKRERAGKEKKEPNGVKTEAVEELDETSAKKAMDYLSKSFAPREAAVERSARATRYNPGDRDKAGRLLRNKMKGAERAGKIIGKSFTVKEESDVPFEGPYDKPGVRKDKYGNVIKNVAKHAAKKAMTAQKNEGVEELEEKRGLWDNIHAKRERIKSGSGERMRKPGSKGAPSAADLKASQTEEVEISEEKEIPLAHRNKYDVSHYRVLNNGRDVTSHDTYDAANEYAKQHRKNLRTKGLRSNEVSVHAYVKEEVEIDEVAPPGAKYERMVKHIKKAYAKDGKLTGKEKGIAYATAWKAKNEEASQTDEAFEQIDELSTKSLEKYKNVARADAYDADASDDEPRFRKRAKGLMQANKAIRKNFVKGVDEEVEQIDELSKKTLGSYAKKAVNQTFNKAAVGGMAIASPSMDSEERGKKLVDKAAKRMMGAQKAISKLTKEEQDFIAALNTDTLDEARGRPRKAGAKEFTINPRTKEKLMHDNPEHMKKIEALQRNGVIPVPKTEAGQHVVNQLTKAKLSMRGGETINFTHGEPHHVSGEHAAKLLTRYAGMKPDEKEAFQKKIGHSHASLKSEL